MYKIIMSKGDFFKIHNKIKIMNIEIKNEEVRFNVNHDGLLAIKNSGYSYVISNSFKKRFILFFKKHHNIIIGIIFLFCLVYINNYRVSNIIFNYDTPINDEIEEELKSSFKSLFIFDFINIDYNKFSRDLRRKYSEYSYIDVYSKSNNIYVDVFTYDEYKEPIVDEMNSDIIAKKDGIIDYYYVYNGNSLIYKNKYVKKGDVLIESINEDNTSKGYIMAYTYDKINIDIKKIENVEEVTNNIDRYYQLSLFNNNFNLGKKNEFELSEIVLEDCFNFFDFITIKKIEEVEKNVIIKENTIDDAIVIGQNIIVDNFNKNKTSKDEKIIDIFYYDYVEDDEFYYITYIAKKLESIGIYKESMLDEIEFAN